MKITLGSIVSYVVGISLVILGLLFVLLSRYAIIPVIAGLLILPPIRRQFAKRFGMEFSRGAAAGIGAFGVIALLVVIIMAASSGGAAPGEDVSNVSVSAQGTSPEEAKTLLEVEWNSRAQSAVDPDPDSLTKYNSNEGEKFVVIRTTIVNAGEEDIELTPRLFKLQSGNVEYDYQPLFGSGNSLSGVTVKPSGSHSAWVAFSVPDDVTEAEIIVNQEAYYQEEVAVSFTHNQEMAINMSD